MTFEMVVRTLWRHRFIVLTATLLFAVGAGVWGLLMKPVYRAEVLLMPVSRDSAQSGFAALMSQVGGLAALAGLGSSESNSTAEYLAFIQSPAFVLDFINESDAVPVLFPDSRTESGSAGEGHLPTPQSAYRKFVGKVLSVDRSRESGLVTLAIEWHDRVIAAKWASDFVSLANQQLRARAIKEANASLEYLHAELEKSHVVEVRSAIYKLLESQLNTVMLANGREQFAFRVVSPALVPDENRYVRPRRAVMVVLGGFIGFVIGAVISMLRSTWRQDDVGAIS